MSVYTREQKDFVERYFPYLGSKLTSLISEDLQLTTQSVGYLSTSLNITLLKDRESLLRLRGALDAVIDDTAPLYVKPQDRVNDVPIGYMSALGFSTMERFGEATVYYDQPKDSYTTDTFPVYATPRRIQSVDDKAFKDKFKLTDIQLNVIKKIAEGLGVEQTAKALGRSKHTVSDQLKDLFVKLGVKGQVQLAVLAAKHNIV